MTEVLFEIARPHVALITLNRPAARNAVNAAIAVQLDAAVKRVENDPDIWAALLTGAGGVAFSAGADLKEVSEGNIDGLYTRDGAFAGFVKHRREKAWIAAVEGFAMAGGCELALACDMIVASEQSTFALPEVTRGLVAAAGGVYRMTRAIPRAIAMELIATGGRIDAARAAQLGLVNKVTKQGEAIAGALDLADRICANAPVSVRESLSIARRSFDLDDETLFRLGLEAQERVKLTDDYKEGPRAFIEKRPPIWRGR